MNTCNELHLLLSKQQRYYFPFEKKWVPKNGIYFLFEKGEYGHNTDRVVRIGTHTGNNQLRSRIIQHFVKENKDRSIFRKNIGRAYLNSMKDPFLSKWELDITSKINKEKYLPVIDLKKLQEIETFVSQYIQKHFSFVVIEVMNKEHRLAYESKLISTVSLCKDCSHSDHWFGLNSPIEKIRTSGLWQVNELYKKAMSEEAFVGIMNIVLKRNK